MVGVGQEHRAGRWWRLTEAKNGVCFVPIGLGSDGEKEEGWVKKKEKVRRE